MAKIARFLRSPHFVFVALFILLASATVRHMFSTYAFGYMINVTSRPHQRSVILKEVTDWGGTTLDLFVKSNNKTKCLSTCGDDLPCTRVEELWWSKDGTFLIINAPGGMEKNVAWDFLHERLVEGSSLARTIKSRGGRGEMLLDNYHVIGDDRTAFTWEAAELERAEQSNSNIF